MMYVGSAVDPNAGHVTANFKVHIELYHCAPCLSAKLKAELAGFTAALFSVNPAIFTIDLRLAKGTSHADI